MTQQMSGFLREHPRFMGALFTMILLLTQVGSAAANNSACIPGP